MNNTSKKLTAGKKIAWHSKLVDGLQARDHGRVRDYLAHLILDYPDINQCPVDRSLLDEAVDLVLQKYNFNPDAKSLQEIFYRK